MFRRLPLLLASGLFASCASERAELDVNLARPPVAWRFVVHGNCFAGWYLTTDLVIHEKMGLDVILDFVSVRVEDSQTGVLLRLGERLFDPGGLQELVGEGGAIVRGHSSLLLSVSVGSVGGAVDAPEISRSVVVSGDVLGHDEQGTVRIGYRITATVTIDDQPLPSSGACGRGLTVMPTL